MHLDLPRERKLSLDRPAIVGILNLTPDSFSDGGEYANEAAAVEAARLMLEAGADVIDIGGESTRPGSMRVEALEQVRRVVPVLEEIVDRFDAVVSIDTTRVAVAREALDAGASIINDVSSGRDEPEMLDLAAERGVPTILMHMRGQPSTMQNHPTYDDVVAEVRRFLVERAEVAITRGVEPGQIIIDPGIGFGKTRRHNLELMANLDELVSTGYPVMLGASRKRFLGEVTGIEAPRGRDEATVATTVLGITAGARLFRVHEVTHNRHAADVTFAIRQHRTVRRPGGGRGR